jgi:hypothetical protein
MLISGRGSRLRAPYITTRAGVGLARCTGAWATAPSPAPVPGPQLPQHCSARRAAPAARCPQRRGNRGWTTGASRRPSTPGRAAERRQKNRYAVCSISPQHATRPTLSARQLLNPQLSSAYRSVLEESKAGNSTARIRGMAPDPRQPQDQSTGGSNGPQVAGIGPTVIGPGVPQGSHPPTTSDDSRPERSSAA